MEAFTISDILKLNKVEKIDFWSLDIEDHEYNALMGLDFSIHRPTYILIEVWKENPKIFKKMASEGYTLQNGIHGRRDISGWAHHTPHRDFLWKDSKYKHNKI